MKEILVVIALFGALFMILALADATEKKSCEVLLTESQVHGKNVTDDRNAKEQKIASLQTALYMEQQRRQMLEKELADLKQPKEEKKAE